MTRKSMGRKREKKYSTCLAVHYEIRCREWWGRQKKSKAESSYRLHTKTLSDCWEVSMMMIVMIFLTAQRQRVKKAGEGKRRSPRDEAGSAASRETCFQAPATPQNSTRVRKPWSTLQRGCRDDFVSQEREERETDSARKHRRQCQPAAAAFVLQCCPCICVLMVSERY